MVRRVHPGMEDADDGETAGLIEMIDHIKGTDELAESPWSALIAGTLGSLAR